MAQKDEKSKLKQLIIYYIDEFFNDNLEEKCNR
jgi:hypothetical protein